jgi:hypothetical protein
MIMKEGEEQEQEDIRKPILHLAAEGAALHPPGLCCSYPRRCILSQSL